MADLASFWVGDRLGPIEIASLKSFLRHGDSVTVYAPAPLENLPEGVIWRDAEEIMSCNPILCHRKTKSPAIHADLFRYQLMAKTNQIWVDLDMIALRPFDFPSDWVFGFETPNEVNIAVLRLPKHSKTLAKLLEMKPNTVGFPPFMKNFRRFKYWLRSLGRGLPLTQWPWGATGPRALTYYATQTGELLHALPISAFYAIPLHEAARFLEPGGLTRQDFPADAWGVHLWGKELRSVMTTRHGGEVPEGSFLDLALRGAL